MNKFEIHFRLILVLVILQKTEYLISLYAGIEIFSLFSFSPFILIMIYVSLALFKILSFPSLSRNLVDPFLRILLIYIVLQFLRGVLFNPLDIVLQEFSTGLLVFYAYVLGRNKLIDFSRPFYLKLVIVAAILVFLGTFHFREHLNGKLDVLIPTATLAYEISPILDLWPLVFLSRYFKGRKLVALAPLMIYLAFQLFFLKRAPSVRAITYIMVAEVFLLQRSNNIYSISRNISALFIIVFSFLAFLPEDLRDRFNNGDRSRQDEAVEMLSQLSSGETIFGRGLGGWFELEEGGGVIELHNRSYGKYIVHIGIAYPVLKGGLVLLLLILLHYVITLARGVINYSSMTSVERMALVFIIVYGLFRLIEGPFSPGAMFDGLCFGYSLGRLNAKT